MDSKEKSRSWFCVLNNPQEIYKGEPHEIAEKVLEEWVNEHPTRTGAVAYCISAEGLIHLHMVLEDSHMARFSTLKNTYPKAHLDPTKGNKEQAEDYIQKKGKFQEKGEQVLYIARYGEIKGCQGARKDFEVIEELIAQGKTIQEILDYSFSFRRFEPMIRRAFFDNKRKNMPFKRDVNCVYHVGESGSGKSYEAKKIADEKENEMYFVTTYENGYLDGYCGEDILFLDEFRGQMQYNKLLTMLDGYKGEQHARYSNVTLLCTQVHITSVIPPEKLYENMVTENRLDDSFMQLKRRIKTIVYHWKDENGYHNFELPMSEYIDYSDLKRRASMENPIKIEEIEINIVDGVEIPF